MKRRFLRFAWVVPVIVVLALLAHQFTASASAAACDLPPMVRLGSSAAGLEITDFDGVSGDGRFVAVTTILQLAPSDTNPAFDVFVHDRQECAIELVSVDAAGGPANGSSLRAVVSADGRYVAFQSMATDLVTGDANSVADVFVRDRLLGVTTRVSVAPAGQQSPFASIVLDISGDGQVVLFRTCADLLNNPNVCIGDGLYVRDLGAQTTERVAVDDSGCISATISNDGRYLAFTSCDPDLVPTQDELATDLDPDVFLHDRATAGTTLITAGDGQQCGSGLPRLSGNARFIAFSSVCTTLVPGDTNGFTDIFVHDLQTGMVTRLVNRLGQQANSGVFQPDISDDGRYVSFISFATNLTPDDTLSVQDVYVHDRLTGATKRASQSVFGAGGGNHSFTPIRISGDGTLVCFESAATNLGPADPNGTTVDTYCARWQELSVPPNIDLMLNGSFDGAAGHPLLPWQPWAQPDPVNDIVWFISDWLNFYRDSDATQAVVLQHTFAQILAGAPLVAEFDLGNSSNVRKRVSVLIHDADFSDLHVCTFWLDAHAPLTTYRMSTHTTELWANATISFYAATAGSSGGHYLLDDVSLVYDPAASTMTTECFDPNAPAPTMDLPGPDLIVNGGFEAGLLPWGTFGQIVWQIAAGVFEFQRPPGQPAGVVLQNTGAGMTADQVLTATFDLGNSSAVRKRVTVLLHDADFSDLSACTFWLAPSAPLAAYQMRTYSTRPWTSAMVSVYAATIGAETWTRLDNVSLRRTGGESVSGTDCLEPGSVTPPVLTAGRTPFALRRTVAPPQHAGGPLATPRREIAALSGGQAMPWPQAIDLRDVDGATLRFASRLVPSHAHAEVQVSVDGVGWESLSVVPSSESWLSLELPLDAYRGLVVHVRFVLDVAGESHGHWLVRDVMLADRR